MRRLIVDDRVYLWRVEHRHVTGSRPKTCMEVLRIFAEGNKSGVLRLLFREQEGWGVGYPQAGVVWSTGTPISYNLNRPAVVTALIAHVVPAIWDPDARQAVQVDDAIPMLGASRAPQGA